jgi:hypothetical protein
MQLVTWRRDLSGKLVANNNISGRAYTQDLEPRASLPKMIEWIKDDDQIGKGRTCQTKESSHLTLFASRFGFPKHTY